jgi:hypothetical protein
LKAAFSSSMREGEHAIYDIKESTPPAVEGMLSFFYTGSYSVPSSDLHVLFNLAAQYEVDELCTDVAEQMLEDLTPENIHARMQPLNMHKEKAGAAWSMMLTKLKEDDALLTAALTAALPT